MLAGEPVGSTRNSVGASDVSTRDPVPVPTSLPPKIPHQAPISVHKDMYRGAGPVVGREFLYEAHGDLLQRGVAALVLLRALLHAAQHSLPRRCQHLSRRHTLEARASFGDLRANAPELFARSLHSRDDALRLRDLVLELRQLFGQHCRLPCGVERGQCCVQREKWVVGVGQVQGGW
eukprot:1902184-Rhodomonas_salina.2